MSKHESQLLRLRKIEGQIRGIQKMIIQDRYCMDILTQIKSVKHAIEKVETNILKKHIETCVTKAFLSDSEDGKKEKIEELIHLISKYT